MKPMDNKEIRLMNEMVDDVNKKPLNESVSKWAEKIRVEIADKLGMDLDDVTIISDNGKKCSIEGSGASNNESEWDVYKSDKDAYDDAIEQNADMFESDPEVLEGAKWLKDFVYVSKTDIRLIAGEDASSYVDDIRDEDEGERVCEEAGNIKQYEKLKEKIEDLELENLDKKGEKKLAKLQKDMEKLIDKSADKLHDEIYDRVKKELEDDPMSFAEELGYDDISKVKWLNVDYEEASKYVVDTDGVAHTLDRYDGEELELKSGTAYGTN